MTKPHFVECSVPSVTYLRGETVDNKPVNLALILQIDAVAYRWYPDNVGLPSIRFRPMADLKADLWPSWVYRDAEVRDRDFQRLLRQRDA